MKKLIKFSLILFFTIAIVACNQSKQSKPEPETDCESIVGLCFYQPPTKTTLSFVNSDSVVFNVYNGYPKGRYTTLLNTLSYKYTYDSSLGTGSFDGVNFQLTKKVGANQNFYGIRLNNDLYFILEKDWSKKCISYDKFKTNDQTAPF